MRARLRVITLNDDAALIDYVQPIVSKLRASTVRVDADFCATHSGGDSRAQDMTYPQPHAARGRFFRLQGPRCPGWQNLLRRDK